jgi:hypothetical protein
MDEARIDGLLWLLDLVLGSSRCSHRKSGLDLGRHRRGNVTIVPHHKQGYEASSITSCRSPKLAVNGLSCETFMSKQVSKITGLSRRTSIKADAFICISVNHHPPGFLSNRDLHNFISQYFIATTCYASYRRSFSSGRHLGFASP